MNKLFLIDTALIHHTPFFLIQLAEHHQLITLHPVHISSQCHRTDNNDIDWLHTQEYLKIFHGFKWGADKICVTKIMKTCMAPLLCMLKVDKYNSATIVCRVLCPDN